MNIIDNKKFLESFRRLEKAIRDDVGTTTDTTSPVVVYEGKLEKKDPDKANYLTHLRQKRNVITHNAEYSKKVICTDFDLQFLEDLIYDITSASGIVKDFYIPFKSLPAVSENDTILAACERIKSCKNEGNILYILSADKKSLYYITTRALLKELGSGKKLSSKIKTLNLTPVESSVNSKMTIQEVEDLTTRPTAVTSAGKYVGILF